MTDFSALRPVQATKSPTDRSASEYGGVEGMIQPPPHDVADHPHEQLILIYNTDTAAEVEVNLGFDDPPLMRGYLD